MYSIYRKINGVQELGFYIETSSPLSERELQRLRWLVSISYEPQLTSFDSFLDSENIVEIGPRLSIETAFSSSAISICYQIGIKQVTRFECTSRYVIGEENGSADFILKEHLDRMTQQRFMDGINTFDIGTAPKSVEIIDLIGLGKDELVRQNKPKEKGWGLDYRDIDYYFDLFAFTLKRNPTDVEMLQIANGNSEHSRHWFFKGKIVIDGKEMPMSLFEVVQRPLKKLGKENRSLIAFNDNVGAIKGFKVSLLIPDVPGMPSRLNLSERVVHITATAETHNHPTSVAAFPGAETGAGGRIRDTSAGGRGSFIGIGAAGYSVGNLFIPGYEIPGEVVGQGRPSKYASPLEILIQGSNGVSDYGNKFGEPLVMGFTRTFGQEVDGEWLEYRKPILYTAGTGKLLSGHEYKQTPEIGMCIVRIGGPAYPIGVGGGSASSVMPGQSTEALDYASVQRGNAQMENRACRVIRACIEMGEKNPIASIHDQGAGGPSNVLTELLEPLGGKINIRGIMVGDKTMSVLEIWSAEYQEGFGFLISRDNLELFQSICERENVNCEVLGEITGSGKVVVEDPQTGTTPVNLDLEHILSKMPPKTFESNRKQRKLKPLELPEMTVAEALRSVFKLPSVGSKGFLVHKADRSVTGLVAQQQCCGIAQIPIANVGIKVLGYFDRAGSASALGEQPIKMLIDPAAGARMSLAEMLTNIASAKITDLKDVSYRPNWMAPAKLPHEGARLWDAANAQSDLAIELGIAADGGKDSLTMAAKVGEELVKAPCTLVVYGYAPMEDVTKKLTPDIKKPGESVFVLIDIGQGKNRLGGSALAQAFNQLGNDCPDIDNPKLLRNSFLMVQQMISEGLILSMHDKSDGGLITAVSEMCMASRCGFNLSLPQTVNAFAHLFNEEAGFVIEIDMKEVERFKDVCKQLEVPIEMIGTTTSGSLCTVRSADGTDLFMETILTLRSWWETTSFEIEKLQMNPDCAAEEFAHHNVLYPGINECPAYNLTFEPKQTQKELLEALCKPCVAIIRDEGSNSDREMQAACYAAGLAPTDVAMSDLLEGRINLDQFQGIVFVGGFSRMDVFGSAKGWAGIILENESLKVMFDRFYDRDDTFSLGVCNGCQLMALLGWAPWKGIPIEKQPRFVHNISGRFESRWTQVEILPSPSILFAGMEGSKLGVWTAHGEGQLVFPDLSLAEDTLRCNLTPLAYVNPHGNMTRQYPYNPNGSPQGITALCSSDGRHLAMMPHPERSFMMWQWPWSPPSWGRIEASPWLRMFQNAREWCVKNQNG